MIHQNSHCLEISVWKYLYKLEIPYNYLNFEAVSAYVHCLNVTKIFGFCDKYLRLAIYFKDFSTFIFAIQVAISPQIRKHLCRILLYPH